MKKIIILSLLIFTSCKKDEKETNLTTQIINPITLDVIGQSLYPNGQILLIKKGSTAIDSVYNTKRTNIKVNKDDTLIITDSDLNLHSIKIYLDKKISLDTSIAWNQFFNLKYIIK
jgi:hypothetical protein